MSAKWWGDFDGGCAAAVDRCLEVAVFDDFADITNDYGVGQQGYDGAVEIVSFILPSSLIWLDKTVAESVRSGCS